MITRNQIKPRERVATGKKIELLLKVHSELVARAKIHRGVAEFYGKSFAALIVALTLFNLSVSQGQVPIPKTATGPSALIDVQQTCKAQGPTAPALPEACNQLRIIVVYLELVGVGGAVLLGVAIANLFNRESKIGEVGRYHHATDIHPATLSN